MATLAEGNPLSVTGAVTPDTDWSSWALLGIALNQSTDGGEDSALPWSAEGYSGIRYAIDNRANSPLRLQIQGMGGYPDEAWCAEIGASDASGQLQWNAFTTECWTTASSSYPPEIPLQYVMVQVPGAQTQTVPFDFCIDRLEPF